MESIFFHIDVNSAFLSWTAIDQLQKAKETDTLDSAPAITSKSTPSKRFASSSMES